MPFTPYHFGPHACVALPLHRYLDVPVFLGANIILDIEPLLVISLNLNGQLHGYCHTLLIGGALGLVWGCVAYPFRKHLAGVMSLLRLPYAPSLGKMAVSGLLGAWLHVLFDSVLYPEMQPLFPCRANPLLGVLSLPALYTVCQVCFAPALLLWLWQMWRWKKTE